MTNTANTFAPLRVHLLWFPEAFLGTLFSSMDVLRVAASILHLQKPNGVCPITWKVIGTDGGEIEFDQLKQNSFTPQNSVKPVPERTLIVVPGIFMLNLPDLWNVSERYPELMALLRNHVRQGGLLAVTFNGMIFPARAGLLEGVKNSLHWSQKSMFTSRLPALDFSGDLPMSRDGNLFNCVAPADQTGFMLYLLGELCSKDLSTTCGQLLNYQHDRQLLTNNITQQKLLLPTSNSPVFRAKQWMQANTEKPYRLAELAQVASVSERTLLRHFKAVVGLTPLEYLQELRLERAKIMLEVTLDNLHTIALACGYQNAPTLHRLFKKKLQITPAEYRKRFSLRSARKHWRVETIYNDFKLNQS
jgi:transcriptional regulator GlxA family with amidase domain